MDSALAHRSPSFFCTWVMKHVTSECGVGRKMLRWKLWDMDACPCCKALDEMTTHYPFCEATDMMEAYDKAVEEFSMWMKEAGTDPCIEAFFYSALKECSFPSTCDNWTPDEMLFAIAEQIEIGWNNILFGRLSTKWVTLQELHLSSKCSRKSPGCWAADITYQLLQISHKLWTTRNGILNERNEHGLLLAEGQKLNEAIIEHYGHVKAVLLPEDYHFLNRPLYWILEMSASDRYSWLGNIKMAHKFMHIARLYPITRMRQSMESWLQTGYLHPTSTDDDVDDNKDDNKDT
jgi:hypothetical protein